MIVTVSFEVLMIEQLERKIHFIDIGSGYEFVRVFIDRNLIY